MFGPQEFSLRQEIYGGRANKYLRQMPIDTKELLYARNFYVNNTVNTNCRGIVMNYLCDSSDLVIKWGLTKKRHVNPAYAKLLLTVLHDLVDSMMMYGFAVWNLVVARDEEGVQHVIPHVVDPTTGITYVCVARDLTMVVEFWTSFGIGSNSVVEHAYGKRLPVYVFDHARPLWDGRLFSPVSGVLMQAAQLQHRQNCDAEAIGTLSRPAMVTQRRVDPITDRSIYEHLASDITGQAPNLFRRSMTTFCAPPEGRGHGDSDPGNALDSLILADAYTAHVNEVRTDRSGAPLTWNGSALFVPDQLTGRWPERTTRGAYYSNKHPLQDGEELVLQHLPKRDTELLQDLLRFERSICAMWGVPESFVNIPRPAYKEDLVNQSSMFVRNLAYLVKYACAALQTILDDSFRKSETRQLASAYVSARMRNRTAEQLTELRGEVRNANRYHVKFVLPCTATIADLLKLRQVGLKGPAFDGLVEQMYGLPKGSMDSDAAAEAAAKVAAAQIAAKRKPPSEGPAGTSASPVPETPSKKAKTAATSEHSDDISKVARTLAEYRYKKNSDGNDGRGDEDEGEGAEKKKVAKHEKRETANGSPKKKAIKKRIKMLRG